VINEGERKESRRLQILSYYFRRQGLAILPRLALNSWAQEILQLGVHYHAQHEFNFNGNYKLLKDINQKKEP
jgi:hypothetical protein